MRRISRAWDEIDLRLLDLLQSDADQTLRELGDQIGLSASAVHRRVSRYKRDGLLRTVAILDARTTGSMVQALVMLSLAEESSEHHRRLGQRLRDRPEIQQCYALSGRWDYAVVITAPSIGAVRELGNELFKDDDNIRRYETLFVLDTVKSGQAVPARDLLIGPAKRASPR